MDQTINNLLKRGVSANPVSSLRFNAYISGKCEPTLKVAREVSKKLNIDANIVLGI